MDSKLGAFFVLSKISEDLPETLVNVLKYFCYQNYSITEISRLTRVSTRKASNMVHEALFRLCIFFGLVKVRNTIKGQGVKKKLEVKTVS